MAKIDGPYEYTVDFCTFGPKIERREFQKGLGLMRFNCWYILKKEHSIIMNSYGENVRLDEDLSIDKGFGPALLSDFITQSSN